MDIEGSLLLFLAAHPEVELIVLRDSQSRPLFAGGRRAGAPVLFPPGGYSEPLAGGEGVLLGSWPLRSHDGQTGTLETALSVAGLVRIAIPGIGPQFTLQQRESVDQGSLARQGKDSLLVSATVRDDAWPAPIRWTLVCSENRSSLVESVTALATRFRTTVILNVTVMSLALVLGVIGFQQARRTMVLEAENRQQARMRELERQVMHNERLASVGRLAAGMAHEINNPLEGMGNYLGLLEEDLRSSRMEESLELVGRVREGLERVAGIIDQVLTYSDPGTAPHSSLDLNQVIEETVKFVRSNPTLKRAEIRLQTSPEELRIMGNRVTIGQLFLNLLMNACQVQPGGGQIEVSSLKDGSRAVVLVADNGPGIAPDALARIFEPFFSTRGSAGLGLSVCHGIVADHRGSIRAENRMEGGALFHVEFPLENSSSPESAGAKADTQTNCSPGHQTRASRVAG